MRIITKEDRLAERQHLIDFYKATVTEYKDADCIVATYPSGLGCIIFDGTAGKPTNHYTFKTEARRDEFIEKHLTSKRKRIEYKTEQKEKNKGVLNDSAATAKAIRQRLKTEFPEIKFSVTSSVFSMGNSVDISWVDGPVTSLVERITKQYQYGSFDGMTDSYNYHSIDKSLDCPGAKYVSCSRDQSQERKAEIEFQCFEKHGQSTAEFYNEFGGNTWRYENTNPETWHKSYQERLKTNQEEDNAIYIEQAQVETKQYKLDDKLIDFTKIHQKKESEKDYEKAKEHTLDILPFIPKEELFKLKEAIESNDINTFTLLIQQAEKYAKNQSNPELLKRSIDIARERWGVESSIIPSPITVIEKIISEEQPPLQRLPIEEQIQNLYLQEKSNLEVAKILLAENYPKKEVITLLTENSPNLPARTDDVRIFVHSIVKTAEREIKKTASKTNEVERYK